MNNLLKEKSKFTYSLKVKTARRHQDLRVKMPFCQKVVILTKIRPKIRLFWKKSLISDHGLLKRTIVGTLHNPNPPSCRVKTSKFVRLATCKIHFCTNLHLNNNFLSVKWGSRILNFFPEMGQLHQGTFIYAFGIIKNRFGGPKIGPLSLEKNTTPHNFGHNSLNFFKAEMLGFMLLPIFFSKSFVQWETSTWKFAVQGVIT